jgi:hypothetical protein
MANLFELKDRRVIPNWRSFGKTAVLGELNSIQSSKTILDYDSSIDRHIIDWKLNKTIIHGSELLSAAIVNNKKDDKYVLEAANFILMNSNEASLSQISLASSIVNKTFERDLSNSYNDVTFNCLDSLLDTEPIRNKIRNVKALIVTNPINPILYVELSRYYSILGQEEKSIKTMKIALQLAPNNRYVLRCATRLFTHYYYDDIESLEYIHSFIRKNPLTKVDPWLTSTEISISTMRGRTSRFIKIGIELINSKNINPFNYTELASSLGTVELNSGGTKKSRNYFNKALISPNDNSLAQIEWASIHDKQLDINPNFFNVKMNFEALTLDSYHNQDFYSAINNATKWFFDMPFSKRPIMLGSNIASTILKNQKMSISFLKAGLLSHPNDPQLINNIAYSLALDNNPQEALTQISKLKNEMDYGESTKVCLIATKGLSYFRDGQPEIGRKFYIEAIERTNQIQNQQLYWLAILNYVREEILIGSNFCLPFMKIVYEIPDNLKNFTINILKQDVIRLFEENRNMF